MKRGRVIAIGVLLVLVALGVAARVWWRNNAGQILEQGRQAMADGRTFGGTATATRCLDEVLQRHTRAAQSFGATIGQSLFFKGCLDTGADRQLLCAQNSDHSLTGNAKWLGAICRDRAPGDRYCPTVLQPLAEACKTG